MTTTKKETIKYKISFQNGISPNEKLKRKLSVTKGAAESKRKREIAAVTICYLSEHEKKTEISATLTQFKSINEALAVFLKLSVSA